MHRKLSHTPLRRSHQMGFSLLELMIVMVIGSILISTMYYNWGSQVERQKVIACSDLLHGAISECSTRAQKLGVQQAGTNVVAANDTPIAMTGGNLTYRISQRRTAGDPWTIVKTQTVSEAPNVSLVRSRNMPDFDVLPAPGDPPSGAFTNVRLDIYEAGPAPNRVGGITTLFFRPNGTIVTPQANELSIFRITSVNTGQGFQIDFNSKGKLNKQQFDLDNPPPIP